MVTANTIEGVLSGEGYLEDCDGATSEEMSTEIGALREPIDAE
jgi:hypothetical protein